MSEEGISFESKLHEFIYSSPIAQDVCVEMLSRAVEYWLNVRGQKKLNVLDLGSQWGFNIYNLWCRAIKNYKGLEKVHLYMSNNTFKNEEFDKTCMQKRPPGPEKRVVVHYVPSHVSFHEMKAHGFKDFRMNIVTCWTETMFHHWQNITGLQYFFYTMLDFMRPGGLFLSLSMDGSKVFESLKTEYEIDPANVYASIPAMPDENLVLAMSRLSLQNMIAAYIRHPQDVFFHMAFEKDMQWVISSPCAAHMGVVESISQKYGFFLAFDTNVARFVKYVSNTKRPVHRWWESFWEFSKLFRFNAIVFDPEEEHFLLEASRMFYS